MVLVCTPTTVLKHCYNVSLSEASCQLKHITFHPMPNLTTFSCRANITELGLIIDAIDAMSCKWQLRYLTLMIVNRKMTGRKELAKERLGWRALEGLLVSCPGVVELSVLYLYGAYRSASWGETKYGAFSEYSDREDKVFETHGKAMRRWLARVGQRSTIWRCVKTAPWAERYGVSARAGNIERMFGPAMY